MSLNVGKEVAALQRMTVRELRNRYAEIFGEETRAGNKAWLVKRIIWRLQSQAEGDLSERARQRAAELANDADVRMSPAKSTATAVLTVKGDDRLSHSILDFAGMMEVFDKCRVSFVLVTQ